MKRLLPLLLALAACSPSGGPEAGYLGLLEKYPPSAAGREAVLPPAAPPAAGDYGPCAGNLPGLLAERLGLKALPPPAAPAASVLYSAKKDGYEERRLRLAGGATGDYGALLLLPYGGGPRPAVIGLHGHGSSPAEMRDAYFGAQLAKAGFAVLLPELRVMGCDRAERALSEKLYRAGFTLIGLRAYEALQAYEYLRASGIAAEGRIGVMGHSGGSGAALLAAWLEPGLAAAALDAAPEFLDSSCGGWHCETVPELAAYWAQVSDVEALGRPAGIFSYGFKGSADGAALLSFFEKTLRGRGGRAAAPGARCYAGRYIPTPSWLAREAAARGRYAQVSANRELLRREAAALARAWGLAGGEAR